MKVLPPRTAPPRTQIPRRHTPRSGHYETYRPCLRWEFGHTCAFCLTHESDLSEHGVEGTGLTWIEHQQLRSSEAGRFKQDTYDNCFYACRFCNSARGTQPSEDAHGIRLLDPCRSAWADRFTRVDDRLEAHADDADAARTHRAYDLDDPRKRAMRSTRDDVLTEALRAVRECPAQIDLLLRRAEAPGERRTELLHAAASLRTLLNRARRDLQRFAAIPDDADATCRCTIPSACTLPAFLAGQLLDVPA